MRNLQGLLWSCLLVIILLGCEKKNVQQKENLNPDVGSIKMVGSSTILPIATILAEHFMDKYQKITVSIQGGGSGVGIKSIINGTSDIGNASRAIKSKEKDIAHKKKIEVTEFIIAKDAITMIVNNSMKKINNLTLSQIKNIYTGKITNWKDVGGEDKTINIYGRDMNSGTGEFFHGFVLKKLDFATNLKRMESNGSVLEAIRNDPYGIGFVGLGFVKENKDMVKALKVNNVTPLKNLDRYVIVRNLYQYCSQAHMTPSVKKWFKFLYSSVGQNYIEAAGFIKLSTDSRKKMISKL